MAVASPALGAVGKALWADADVTVGAPSAPADALGDECYVAIPSLRRPRYLLSADLGSAASARILRAYNALRPPGPRAARALLAVMAAAGWGPGRRSQVLRVRHPNGTLAGVRGLLAAELGRDPLELALACGVRVTDGVARPVVTVADQAGHPLLFVKLAGTDLHRRRLRNEYEMLTLLHDQPVPGIHVPAPRFWRTWGDHDVLAVEPLPTDVTPLRPRHLRAAAGSLRALHQDPVHHRLRSSPWLEALRERAAYLRPSERDGVAAAIGQTVRRHGGLVVPHTLGHGDWSCWNQAHVPSMDLLALWDWEFGHTEAPSWLDPVHWDYATSTTIRGRPAPRVVARQWAQLRVDDVKGEVALTLHTLDMAVRLFEDGTVGGRGADGTPRQLLATIT